jgi:hypothetical protein
LNPPISVKFTEKKYSTFLSRTIVKIKKGLTHQ